MSMFQDETTFVVSIDEADISSSHKFYTHLPEGGDALDKKVYTASQSFANNY